MVKPNVLVTDADRVEITANGRPRAMAIGKFQGLRPTARCGERDAKA
jgi:hypothetical protein